MSVWKKFIKHPEVTLAVLVLVFTVIYGGYLLIIQHLSDVKADAGIPQTGKYTVSIFVDSSNHLQLYRPDPKSTNRIDIAYMGQNKHLQFAAPLKTDVNFVPVDASPYVVFDHGKVTVYASSDLLK